MRNNRMSARAAEHGRCAVCGKRLTDGDQRYWITEHPDGVHQDCRQWHLEPFPFANDLERMRFVAQAARRAWREVVRDGRWLRRMQRNWPANAKRLADEWLERKVRLQHHIAKVRDRLRF
jgi:hypothetical protein